MRALLKMLALILGVWLLVTSPWLRPVTEPVLGGIPVVGVVTDAGAAFWGVVTSTDPRDYGSWWDSQ